MKGTEKSKAEITDPQYWERVLRKHHLGQDRGLSPKRRVRGQHRTERTTILVGGTQEIIGIDERQYREESGRVGPKGHGPEE